MIDKDLIRLLDRIDQEVKTIEIFEDLPYTPENQENFEKECPEFFRRVQDIIRVYRDTKDL